MHTTLVCPALRKQLQAASNIHEMHKQVVFGVESLHLTAQYPLQLVVSPCQRTADHEKIDGCRQGMKPF